jgi:endonuclease/exonuclease/phosphatase family metal-dependent hydrolase
MRTALYASVILLLFIGCGKTPDPIAAPAQVDPVQSETLTVVTFNIRYGTADDGPDRWENRRSLVLDLLAGYKADVIGLQEALDFQIDQIGRALPDYGAVFVCRDDGCRAGEACPIFYRLDRFEILDRGTFWFSDTPAQPGSKHWGNQIPRICTWVHLKDRSTGKNFFAYNLHLDHQSQVSREKSTQMLADRIGRRPTADPFVVMGDFNADLNNLALRSLLEGDLRPVDSWQVLHGQAEPPGTFHAFSGTPRPGKIDHILVPQGTEVLEAGIDQRSFDGRYPSDHFPVYARITLPRGD